MSSGRGKPKDTKTVGKAVGASDRFQKLPFKPTGSLTQAKIRKAVREVIAQRPNQPQG